MEQSTLTIAKPRIKFILLYVVSVGIIWMIVSALSTPTPISPTVSIVEQSRTPAPIRENNEVSKREKELAQETEVQTSRIAVLQKKLDAAAHVNSNSVDNNSGLTKQVEEQQKTIARLEKQLSEKIQTSADNPGRRTIKLESDNKYLSLALTSQARQTKSLTEEVRMLRAEVERLRKK